MKNFLINQGEINSLIICLLLFLLSGILYFSKLSHLQLQLLTKSILSEEVQNSNGDEAVLTEDGVDKLYDGGYPLKECSEPMFWIIDNPSHISYLNEKRRIRLTSAAKDRLLELVEVVKVELQKTKDACINLLEITGSSSPEVNGSRTNSSETANFDLSIERAKLTIQYLHTEGKIPLDCMVLRADGWAFSDILNQYYKQNPYATTSAWDRQKKDLSMLVNERIVTIKAVKHTKSICSMGRLQLDK